MIHTISKNSCTAKISELGAELKSFSNNGNEYMWSGNPDVWSGTAPILFPIVGRLKNDEYSYGGKIYKMNQHGFARKRNFEVYKKEESHISFILKANKETKLIYPFDFEIIVDFEIDNGSLSVTYYVLNNGQKQMLFTIGSHPAFALQTNNCQLSDYYIEFDKKETLDCYRVVNGLICEETLPLYLANDNIIKLSKDIFNDDALIFKNLVSNQISIKNNITGYDLKVIIQGIPHLGIWAKPAAPYVCIEPWYGFADAVNSSGELTKKEGMINLDPNGRFITEYKIVV